MWRTLHEGSPLDDNLQRISIPPVSRCRCCGTGDLESSAHLFFLGYCTVAVWNYFGNLVGFQGSATSRLLRDWWSGIPDKSVRSSVYHLNPCLICWHLWNARNKAFFDESPMDLPTIVRKVRNDVFLVFRGRPFKGAIGSRSSRLVRIFDISSSPPTLQAGIGWFFFLLCFVLFGFPLISAYPPPFLFMILCCAQLCRTWS